MDFSITFGPSSHQHMSFVLCSFFIFNKVSGEKSAPLKINTKSGFVSFTALINLSFLRLIEFNLEFLPTGCSRVIRKLLNNLFAGLKRSLSYKLTVVDSCLITL